MTEVVVDAVSRPAGASGVPVGVDSRREILSLPPLADAPARFSLSPRTGEPRRSLAVLMPIVLLYAASVVAFAVGAVVWWRSIQIGRFNSASRLASWVNQPPYVWESVVTACALVALTVVLTVLPAVAAYNTWCGLRWSRIAAVVAVVVSGAGFLLSSWVFVSTGLATVGALGLFLPGAGRYFRAWRAFRRSTKPVVSEVDKVFYGPLPEFIPAGEGDKNGSVM